MTTSGWACRLPVACALAAVLAPPAGSAVRDPGGLASPRATRALEALGAAVAAADRGAAEELLQADTRSDAAGLLAELVPAPGLPPEDPWIEVTAAAETPPSDAGHAVLHWRLPQTGAVEPPPRPGWSRPDPSARLLEISFRVIPRQDGSWPGWLVLDREAATGAVDAAVELRFDLDLEEIAGRSTVTLRGRAAATRAALVSVPPGAEMRLLPGSGRIVATGGGDGPADGHVLVELPAPLPGGASRALETEHGAPFHASIRAGRSLYLPTPQSITPWVGDELFRFDVVVDTPADVRSVALGDATELPAAPGRRRDRYACRRPVGWAAVAVGDYTVSRDTSGAMALELWRTREVGGAPDALLGELRGLVATLVERVGELPYSAFRLVEVDMGFAGATSYPSVIFMRPTVLAVRSERFWVLAHEVAHQWWGNSVHGDRRTRWISEGMATHAADLVSRELEGEARFQGRLDDHRSSVLRGLGRGVRPLADAPGGGEVYTRGALAVHALQATLGDGAFWAVLRAWHAQLAHERVSTSRLQEVAERTAGRELASVFDPWLRSTALPVLRVEWDAVPEGDGWTVRGRVLQDSPPFPLDVPLRLLLRDGSSSDHRVAATGAATAFRLQASAQPVDVELDPDGVTPRVHAGEMVDYLRREALACLSRGDADRGLGLLDRLEEHAVLEPALLLERALAHELAGRRAAAGADRAAAVSALPDAAEADRLLLEHADRLLQAGSAGPAATVLSLLDARVRDGSAVPLRLGRALRLLGRDDEARAAFWRAHERRPEDPRPRAALGLPPAARQASDGGGIVPCLPSDSPAVPARPGALRAVALSGGGLAAWVAPARHVVVGLPGRPEPLEGLRPAGLVGLATARAPGSQEDLVVLLEGGRRRSRLTVVRPSSTGGPPVVARHERCPARPEAMAADGEHVLVAWRDGEETDGLRWWRFEGPLTVPSAGPDDDDGLRRLRVDGDPRFTPAGRTSRRPAVHLAGRGWQEPVDDRLAVGDGTTAIWEELAPSGRWRIVAGQGWRDGLVVLLTGDASDSPLPEDALPAARLVAVAPGGRLSERALPPETAAAHLAADGSLVVILANTDDRGREVLSAGCGAWSPW